MSYGMAGMPGNQRQMGLPRGMSGFPVVGGGLGGLPVRKAGKARVLSPDYRRNNSFYASIYDAGFSQNIVREYKVDAVTGAYQYAAFNVNVVNGGNYSSIIVDGATGLTGWSMASGMPNTSSLTVRRLRRSNLQDGWSTISSLVTNTTAFPQNGFASISGEYLLMTCNNGDAGNPTAVLYRYDGLTITIVKNWIDSASSGGCYPCAAMDDIGSGNFYYLVGGISSATNGQPYTRPEIGYVKNGICTVITQDSALTNIVGTLGIGDQMGFMNTRLSVAICSGTFGGKTISEYSLEGNILTKISDLCTFSNYSNDSNCFTFPTIQFSPRDDYFLKTGTSAGVYRVIYGYLNTVGAWVAVEPSVSLFGQGSWFIVAPNEDFLFVRDDSSSIGVRTMSFSRAAGLNFGGVTNYASGTTNARMSTGTTPYRRALQ